MKLLRTKQKNSNAINALEALLYTPEPFSTLPKRDNCNALLPYERGMLISISNNRTSYADIVKNYRAQYLTLLYALTGKNEHSKYDIKKVELNYLKIKETIRGELGLVDVLGHGRQLVDAGRGGRRQDGQESFQNVPGSAPPIPGAGRCRGSRARRSRRARRRCAGASAPPTPRAARGSPAASARAARPTAGGRRAASTAAGRAGAAP